MNDRECMFCQTLEVYRFDDTLYTPGGVKLLHEYRVALVRRSWKKGNKLHAGRTTDYMRAGRGYPLNYCPECGRQLTNILKEQGNDTING